MKKVLLLYEDNHGLLIVAQDYNAVIDYLINEDWLSGNTEIFIGDDETTYNECPINEVFGVDWKKQIRKFDITQFNETFEGCFRIEVESVYGAE